MSKSLSENEFNGTPSQASNAGMQVLMTVLIVRLLACKASTDLGSIG